MASERHIISIRNVVKRFGTIVAVDDISLDIKEGEFFALLGPSGCGKTTLSSMIAGFETPSEGDIMIDGTDMIGVPPNKRPINMVFQSYAVFPHLTVAQNVGYGLRLTGTPRQETAGRVARGQQTRGTVLLNPRIGRIGVEADFGWFLTRPLTMLIRCPVLSVPSGFASNGVPTGLQIVGRTYDDTSVFRAAAAYESAASWCDWASNQPKI